MGCWYLAGCPDAYMHRHISENVDEVAWVKDSAAFSGGLSELGDRAFSLIVLGSDRAVRATYILGELAYERPY